MNPFDDLKERGFLYQTTSEEAIRNLLAQEKVTFYVGFDPTGNSLHVGHLLPVMAMRRLQAAGHIPIVLVGGATAQIGDPSFRNTLRPIMTLETIEENVRCIRGQLARFIDDSEGKAIFVNNNDWLGKLGYLELLREVGSIFSVNRMLAQDSVKSRLENGLSFLEFNYSILQGYDFYELNRRYGCKLEMGGQDQWGNMVAGTELVRRKAGVEVQCLTIPLLMNSSTGQKFGKTAGGTNVWLDKERTSVFDYYQFWRNSGDADVQKLLCYFTNLPLPEISALCAPDGNINRAKEILAYETTALAHGEEEAAKAFVAAGTKFGFADKENKIPTTSRIRNVNTSETLTALPTWKLENLPEEGIWVVQLFSDAGLCKSNGEARRLIQGGGAYINDERITDLNMKVTKAHFANGAALLKAGKKNMKQVTL